MVCVCVCVELFWLTFYLDCLPTEYFVTFQQHNGWQRCELESHDLDLSQTRVTNLMN